MKRILFLSFLIALLGCFTACEPLTLNETQSALLVGHWQQTQSEILVDTSQFVASVEGVSFQFFSDNTFTNLAQPVNGD
ncbi:MAG: hypothetical protein AAF399_10665, partial [Bacteroidota bacterium]